jgi:hypothetical protein
MGIVTKYLAQYQNLPAWQYLKTQMVVSNPLAISSAQLRLYFPTQVFLRDKNILSIEVFTEVDMPVSPNGNILPSSANIKQCFLTLYSNDPENPTATGEYVENFPLTALHRLVNGTDPYVFQLPEFIPRCIVWEKSYIDFAPVTGGATTYGNAAILNHAFNVVYTGLDDQQNP